MLNLVQTLILTDVFSFQVASRTILIKIKIYHMRMTLTWRCFFIFHRRQTIKFKNARAWEITIELLLEKLIAILTLTEIG